MYPDFSPLVYLAFAALGTMAGWLISTVLWLISFFAYIPDWAFIAPPMAGLFGGWIVGAVHAR